MDQPDDLLRLVHLLMIPFFPLPAEASVMPLRVVLIPFFALVVAISGCGSGKDKPVKVSGIVTLEGTPVPGALVTFISVSGGKMATGYTAEDGKFDLTTLTRGDGALPGIYKVTVSMSNSEEKPGDHPSMEAGKMDEAQLAAVRQKSKEISKAGKTKEPKTAIHSNYSNKDKTPIQFEVPPPQQPVVIDLKTSGK